MGQGRSLRMFQSRIKPGLQSPENLTETGRSISRPFTYIVSCCCLLVGDFDSRPGPLNRLPEYPHKMAAGFSQSQQSQEIESKQAIESQAEAIFFIT